MKVDKLMDIFKMGNFVVPIYLFQLREKFELPLEEFIFLVYLSNFEERFIFDPVKLGNQLGVSLEDVMVYIDHLTELNYIKMDVVKNDKGVIEEFISIGPFYEKISKFLVEDISNTEIEEKQEKKTIYDKVADGFARPISSIEREIIGSWVENGFSEELILAALKETVFNGVSNLRYMDKILYEWNKKGYKTAADVDSSKQKYQEDKKETKKLDLFDYDWFDDDDE